MVTTTAKTTTDPVSAAVAVLAAAAPVIAAKQHAPALARLEQRRALFTRKILDPEEPRVREAVAAEEPRLADLVMKLSHPRLASVPGVDLLRGKASDTLMFVQSSPGRLSTLRARIERNPVQDPLLAHDTLGIPGLGEQLRQQTDAVFAHLEVLAARVPEIIEHIEPVTGSGPMLTPPPPPRNTRAVRRSAGQED